MTFDFERFSNIAASVYDPENRYTLPQCLAVFWCYFETYEAYIHHPHPPIRASQISRIMEDMPWMNQEDKGGYIVDIDPEEYPIIISLHFKTRYRRCDYNINHFFSGRIREMRLYEVEKGYE